MPPLRDRRSCGPPTLASLPAGLHDIGKIADGFQAQRPDLIAALQGSARDAPYPPHWRHDTAGFVLLSRALSEDAALRALLPPALTGEVSRLRAWLSAINGHHGRPPLAHREHTYRAAFFRQFTEATRQDAISWISAAAELLLPEPPTFRADADLDEAFGPASWLVAGHAVLADWLGSSTRWFAFETRAMSPLQYWTERAQPSAWTAVRDAGLLPPEPCAAGGYQKLWGEEFQPTNLQSLAQGIELDCGPQLFLIEEVTGSGKTEAALMLANRLIAAGLGTGLYFGLPTMATRLGTEIPSTSQ